MAKSVPVRLCLGCREPKQKNELIRIVRSNDGSIQLDLKGKLSGRGAYICRNVSCFDKACKSKALERSLGVSIPEDICRSVCSVLDSNGNG